MPTRESDPGCNSKKLHIGNDFVTIVYNDSQQTVKFGRIKVRYIQFVEKNPTCDNIAGNLEPIQWTFELFCAILRLAEPALLREQDYSNSTLYQG